MKKRKPSKPAVVGPVGPAGHDFGPYITIYEPDFHVAYGSKRVCKRCGAIEWENWCETRASGGMPVVVGEFARTCLAVGAGDSV